MGGNMNIRGLAALLLGVFVLVGCGASGGEPSPLPGGGGAVDGGGATNYCTGRLVAEGTSYIHDMNLSANGGWQQRMSGSVYDTLALHLPGDELHVASTSFGGPVTVEIHDLDTFALKSTFLWTDSTAGAYGRVDGLAVSADGEHVAALVTGSAPFLEIINRNTHEVLYQGNPGIVGTDMVWLTDDLLVFAADINDPNTSLAGGIVAVSLDELASDSPVINLGVFVGFASDEWAVAKPFDFAFSHDIDQLVYAWNGDLWVNELQGEPSHQLTTGPSGLVGPVFSPDGNYIAFVEHQSYSLRDTFVIPSHREEPFFVASGNPELNEAYLLASNTLVETMLVWLDQ